ncbi:MAG: hypothetical protein R3274_07365 [Desulfobacterales bacterium]|nr:hypothetical protein [Desulfobacterales bacterium]
MTIGRSPLADISIEDERISRIHRYHFSKLALMEMAYASRHKLPIGIILMDEELLRKADQALNLAKENGRNRTESLP